MYIYPMHWHCNAFPTLSLACVKDISLIGKFLIRWLVWEDTEAWEEDKASAGRSEQDRTQEAAHSFPRLTILQEHYSPTDASFSSKFNILFGPL